MRASRMTALDNMMMMMIMIMNLLKPTEVAFFLSKLRTPERAVC